MRPYAPIAHPTFPGFLLMEKGNPMKSLLIAASLALAGLVAQAQTPAPAPTPAATPAKALDSHTQEDVSRHRGMARAHEAAAQCLEAGGKHDDCQKQLQADCKGLALGKNCGMRHAH